MLTLTQVGLGMLIASLAKFSSPVVLGGVILFNLGMVAATLHLGKPLKAWRFFLGLKTSWLSREILAFSMLAPIPLALGASLFFDKIPMMSLIKFSLIPLSVIAVYTSVMIYHDTGRRNWRWPMTAFSFYGTMASVALLFVAPWAFVILQIIVLAREGLGLLEAKKDTWSPEQHQARLRLGPLRQVTLFRFGLSLFAVFFAFISPWIVFPFLLGAEILSRHLFFRSVYAPKMPGGLQIQLPHHAHN